jgi:Zinc knuckle
VEKVMRRVEEKEQEKLAYKVVYGRKIIPKVEESIASTIDIGKRKVICGYCKKLNHIANVCRKKLVEIKLVAREELKEKGLCFKCGQEGHMT